jgi:hypothetical protein
LPHCQIKTAAENNFTGKYGLPLSEKTRKIFWQSVHDKSHEKKQAALFVSSSNEEIYQHFGSLVSYHHPPSSTVWSPVLAT